MVGVLLSRLVLGATAAWSSPPASAEPEPPEEGEVERAADDPVDEAAGSEDGASEESVPESTEDDATPGEAEEADEAEEAPAPAEPTPAEPGPMNGSPVILGPMPASPATQTLEESKPSDNYYRSERDPARYGARVGLGPSVVIFDPAPPRRAHVTVDVRPGVAVSPVRGSRFGIMIDGGYSYTGGKQHLALLGVGPALRRFGREGKKPGRGRLLAALLMHGALGTRDGEVASGFRASAMIHVLVYGIDVGYEYLSLESGPRHTLRMMVTLGYLGSRV